MFLEAGTGQQADTGQNGSVHRPSEGSGGWPSMLPWQKLHKVLVLVEMETQQGWNLPPFISPPDGPWIVFLFHALSLITWILRDNHKVNKYNLTLFSHNKKLTLLYEVRGGVRTTPQKVPPDQRSVRTECCLPAPLSSGLQPPGSHPE